MMKSKFSLLLGITVFSFALTHFALAQNAGKNGYDGGGPTGGGNVGGPSSTGTSGGHNGDGTPGSGVKTEKSFTNVTYNSFVQQTGTNSRQVYKNCEWKLPPVMVKGSDACTVKSKTDKNFCTGQIVCDIHSEEGKKVYPSNRMDVFTSCAAEGNICPSPGKCFTSHLEIVEKSLYRNGKGETKDWKSETVKQMIEDEIHNANAGNANK